MISNTRRVQRFAEDLHAFERDVRDEQLSGAPFPFSVCEKLRIPLTALAGTTGFEALLSRALTLSKKRIPRLAPLRVKREDCIEGLTEIDPRLTAEELVEAEIVVVACLVELLCTFLGEALLLRLVHDLWPNASFEKINLGKEPAA